MFPPSYEVADCRRRKASDASHELRTPISLIRTEAEISLRKSRGEPEYREALGHILVEAERMSLLIEGLLSLARADAGREMLDIQRLDLRDTVQKAATEWRPRIAVQRLQFTEDFENRDIFVAGDRTALSRLLNILLDNAVKYMPQNGSVELKLEEKDAQAVITVRDTGIGISEEDRTRIFERFYRADRARSRESEALGWAWLLPIGLSNNIGVRSRSPVLLATAPCLLCNCPPNQTSRT